MILTIEPGAVDYIADQLDTNAINFRLGQGYFSLQTCVYLEEEEQLNDVHVEFNDQGQSQSGGLERIVFFKDRIVIDFLAAAPFLARYRTVELYFRQGFEQKKTSGFFANDLFLGQLLSYDSSFEQANIVKQTQTRDPL